jgi:hypothetical protein
MRYCLPLLVIVCLLGCTRQTYQRSALDEIEWADDEIMFHRMSKAYLIEMHPYEMAVEAALSADPRVAKARVAFPLGWGRSSAGWDKYRNYRVLVETVEPMTADAAAELLKAAMHSAGLHSAGQVRIVVSGSRWAVQWGTASIGMDENPDITALDAP